MTPEKEMEKTAAGSADLSGMMTGVSSSVQSSDGFACWDNLQLAEKDKIFAAAKVYGLDPRPEISSPGMPLGSGKVNLSIGTTQFEGKVPFNESVYQAAERILKSRAPRTYLSQRGHEGFINEVERLVLGDELKSQLNGRIASVQTIGCSGALYIAGLLHSGSHESLNNDSPRTQALISNHSWGNYPQLFRASGNEVIIYDRVNAHRQLDLRASLSAINQRTAPTLLVVQSSNHNGTGINENLNEWALIGRCILDSGPLKPPLVVVCDITYQGYGDGFDEDVAAVRAFIKAGIPVMMGWSASKSCNYYGDRVGALMIIGRDREQTEILQSNMEKLIRAVHSTANRTPAEVVHLVLSDSSLREQWVTETREFAEDIRFKRQLLADGLIRAGADFDTGFISKGQGFFITLGFSPKQDAKMREHGLHPAPEGRIPIPAINEANVDYVCTGIVDASRSTSTS